jgi:hypothetical protein
LAKQDGYVGRVPTAGEREVLEIGLKVLDVPRRRGTA